MVDKTRAFVSHMNDLYGNGDVDIAVHLGDMIDGNVTEEKTLADLELIERELRKVQCPFAVVLGNHCLDAGSPPVDLVNRWNCNVEFSVNKPFYSIEIKKSKTQNKSVFCLMLPTCLYDPRNGIE